MALMYDGALQRVIDSFSKLPGIGPKGAQRIAFHLLTADKQQVAALAASIATLQEKVKFCDICGNVTESSPCLICRDPRRDATKLCVVEEPKDVMAIERTGEFHGRYHVLGGSINPMADVGPADLRIASLLERLRDGTIAEVILALNPNIEGEATTTYLSSLLTPIGVTVTRLASGLPVGSDLEYADEITLGCALAGRRSVQ
ncbi:MAG: recombination protein RecR [Aeriscardovia sp.]|nr:recombination protein RecR [Aeriscardovia sp.]